MMWKRLNSLYNFNKRAFLVADECNSRTPLPLRGKALSARKKAMNGTPILNVTEIK
jgi:hypothetical protein